MLETPSFLIKWLKKEGKLEPHIKNLIIVKNVAYFLYKRGYFKVGGITAKMLKIIAFGFSLCSLFE